jgi:uncharacterized protein (DUF1501 family)
MTLAAAGMSLSSPLWGSGVKRARQTLAPAVSTPNEKILVVVNLYGGNDGLNTVIPMQEFDRYQQLRPNLGFNTGSLLDLDGQPDFKLRPGMSSFKQLFNSGNLAIVNGVGVPLNATRKYDHEAQQFEFQTCDIVRSSTTIPSGWLGRYCDAVPVGDVPPGIDLGGGRLMLTGQVRPPVSIWTIDDFQLQISGVDSNERAARRATYEAIMNIPHLDPVGEQNRIYRQDALAQSETILAATDSYPTARDFYPDTWLGYQLREAAKLIYANIGVQGIGVGFGGYDTHSNQDTNGWHGYLMGNLADSVKALYDDLVNLGLADRVLIATVSEFGRTPWENSDDGTDHGIASSAFVVGTTTNVNGGIYGDYPGLQKSDYDPEDGLITTVDFRSFYATIVANFLGADPVPVVGGSFPILSFV